MIRDSRSRAETVGAQQEGRPVPGRTEQMQVARDQVPKDVLVAVTQEPEFLDLARVGGIVALQIIHVEVIVEPVDERSDELPVVEKVYGLGWRADEIGVAGIRIVGCDQFGDRQKAVDQDQEHGRDHRQPVALEFPPHQPPLRGEVDPFLRGRQLGDGRDIEGFVGDVVGERGAGRRHRDLDVHFVAPPCMRIRGSRKASARSETRTPMIVSVASSIRNEPAR